MRARVKPGHRYGGGPGGGGHQAGEVFDSSPEEIVSAPWCLERYAEQAPKRPTPPTLAEVLAAGYSQEAAERIVAEELWRAERGLGGYGDAEWTDALYAEFELTFRRLQTKTEGRKTETSDEELLENHDPSFMPAEPPSAPDEPATPPIGQPKAETKAERRAREKAEREAAKK